MIGNHVGERPLYSCQAWSRHVCDRKRDTGGWVHRFEPEQCSCRCHIVRDKMEQGKQKASSIRPSWWVLSRAWWARRSIAIIHRDLKSYEISRSRPEFEIHDLGGVPIVRRQSGLSTMEGGRDELGCISGGEQVMSQNRFWGSVSGLTALALPMYLLKSKKRCQRGRGFREIAVGKQMAR